MYDADVVIAPLIMRAHLLKCWYIFAQDSPDM
jgi:hypothetical protein